MGWRAGGDNHRISCLPRQARIASALPFFFFSARSDEQTEGAMLSTLDEIDFARRIITLELSTALSTVDSPVYVASQAPGNILEYRLCMDLPRIGAVDVNAYGDEDREALWADVFHAAHDDSDVHAVRIVVPQYADAPARIAYVAVRVSDWANANAPPHTSG
jgi:hypothetical protein